MNGRWGNMVPGAQHPLRHGLAFLICGLISLSVDALVLKLLTTLFGLHPFVARIAAIMVAMTSGWLSHRTFTFALKTPPTVAEYLRYMAVGWFVSAVNYGVFVIILLLRPVTEPLTALLGSSVVAMFFAYFGMRFAAFRVDAEPQPDPSRVASD
jgi:putative flippase GtrA